LKDNVVIQGVTGVWKMRLMTEEWRWRRKMENTGYRKSEIQRAAN
jgi:hypothetical protein